MSPRPIRHSSPPAPRSGVAALFQRIVGRAERRTQAAGAAERPARYVPAGSRSGEGSESVLPYLAESLTRPGSLDD